MEEGLSRGSSSSSSSSSSTRSPPKSLTSTSNIDGTLTLAWARWVEPKNINRENRVLNMSDMPLCLAIPPPPPIWLLMFLVALDG